MWFESLALRYADIVDEVLGNELQAELEEPAGAQSYSILLQHITAAQSSITAIFLPRVLQWIETTDVSVQENDELGAASARLTRALAFLLASGDVATIARVRELARTRLKSGLDTDFAVEWMKVAMRLDPEFAVPLLESALDASTAESRDAAVKWFAVLFGDRNDALMVSLICPPFNSALLLRMVRLAYVHVARDADVEHEGAYTPAIRDDAESARNSLLGALLDLPGVEGWKAKLDLANDPNFAHFRDRAIAIARERSAEEIDAVLWRESDVVALDTLSETAPKTGEDMFALLRDRTGDGGHC